MSDPDYGAPTSHPHDPRNDDPLDCELECDDADMSDAEREARLRDEHYGCYGEDA